MKIDILSECCKLWIDAPACFLVMVCLAGKAILSIDKHRHKPEAF